MQIPNVPSASLPLCDRCRVVPSFSDTFEVRSPAGTLVLDGEALVDRLKAGRLTGRDWVIAPGVPPILVAAHPLFAPLFATGQIVIAPVIALAAAPPPPPPPPPPVAVVPRRRRAPLPWARIFGIPLVLGGLGYLAFVAWERRDELALFALKASEVLQPPAPGEVATTPGAEAGAPQADPLAPLAARVGAVEEPIAYLHAQALAALVRGGPVAHAEALQFARRAVARCTKDPEALALYALLASQSADPEGSAIPAAEQAIALGLGGPATQIGRAALARTSRDLPGAIAAVAVCSAEGNALCQLVVVDALTADPARVTDAIAALDRLAAAWPSHLGLPRAAALLAATGDRLDAAVRLRALPGGDPEVPMALADLALRDGDLVTALNLARELGAQGPPGLRIGASRALLSKGDAKGMIDLLGDLPTPRGEGTAPVAAEARLLAAQARWLLARDHAEALPAAAEAVAAVVEVGRTDPAVAQVRALVANALDQQTEIARAWSSMDVTRRVGPELARALKTQVALMEARGSPLSDMVPVAEAARTADPSDPYTHVWVVHVHLVGHQYGKAILALRTAIRQVDGQASRRRIDLATLETGSPAKRLRAEIDAHLGNEATYASTLPLTRAVASWLGGDLKAAAAAIAQTSQLESDADALALRARVREASRDTLGAMTDWRKVALLRPKDSDFLIASLASTVAAGLAADAGPIAELVRASQVRSALGPAMLAEVWLARGDRDAALRDLAAAVAADPLDVRSRARLREIQAAAPPTGQ